PVELTATPTSTFAKRALESVVVVETYDAAGRSVSVGTGTVWADLRGEGQGIMVVTSFHVVRNAWNATVTFADGETLPVTGLDAEDEAHDLAMLGTRTRRSRTPHLRCAKAPADPGDHVVALRAPAGLGWS